MEVFADLLDGFDECGCLIKKKKQNKSVLAIILIDALVDIYSQKYINRIVDRKKQMISIDASLLDRILRFAESSPIDQTIGDDIRRRGDAINGLKKEVEDIEKSSSGFDNRFSYLSKQGIISEPTSKSIRMLHEYRNQYLHRMKAKEDDAIAFAMLYYYLYQQLFLAIPINSISSLDMENPIVKKAMKEQPSFSTREFRTCLMKQLNIKHGISFILEEFLKILTDFLMRKYEKIITAIHFLLAHSKDMSMEITYLEKEMNLGKIKIQWIDEESEEFDCYSTKTAGILGKIRSLSSVESEHEGLQKFVEILDRLEKLGSPVIERYYEVDAYLEFQADLARGK